MQRRDFLTTMLVGTALLRSRSVKAQEVNREVFLERAATGTPHQGKVLLAIQAHSDDIPLTSAGTVAKLVKEGYTGYLVRATNDDMGDVPDWGRPEPSASTYLATSATTTKSRGSSGSNGSSTSTTATTAWATSRRTSCNAA